MIMLIVVYEVYYRLQYPHYLYNMGVPLKLPLLTLPQMSSIYCEVRKHVPECVFVITTFQGHMNEHA